MKDHEIIETLKLVFTDLFENCHKLVDGSYVRFNENFICLYKTHMLSCCVFELSYGDEIISFQINNQLGLKTTFHDRQRLVYYLRCLLRARSLVPISHST